MHAIEGFDETFFRNESLIPLKKKKSYFISIDSKGHCCVWATPEKSTRPIMVNIKFSS